MRHQERIPVALQCSDCGGIPKIEGAGRIFTTPEGVEYQLMHNGVKVIKDCYHEFVTEIIKGLKGHHEPQEEKMFYEIMKHIPEHSVMIELGSFWAYYSLWFQKEITGAINYMIEPNPEKVSIGRANFELNGFENGHSFHGCVGENYSRGVDFVDWDGKIHRVEMWSVDEFIRKNEIEHVAILHSDIQGAELQMLHGAEQALSGRKIDHIFISTHGEQVRKDCLELLENRGYHILCSHSTEESFSGDGLIVASTVLHRDDIDSAISLRKHPNGRAIMKSGNPSILDRIKRKIANIFS